MKRKRIEVEGLNFSYGKESLFRSLEMDLEAGNMYGLLGKNGAGKTSLLKLISGLLFPDGGRIDVEGFDPVNRCPEMLADIFFLPEELYLPAMKIKEFETVYAPFYPNFDHDDFMERLKEFNVDHGKKLNGLSYGQKKKFLISFGLASNAAVCLLDEPTNGLDIPSKSQFRKVMASALSEDRLFLISTHQVRDMEYLIDPVIIIDDGKIIFNESGAEISRRLSIRNVKQLPPEGEVLYSEQEINGYRVVTRRQGEEESMIDLETLFNAVTGATDRMADIFSREVVR